MAGVTPAGHSPAMFAPAGPPVQLPQLQPQVSAALDRAIQSGDPRIFMQLATRAGLSPQQAMEFLRQSVQRSGGTPSEGAKRIGQALQERQQAEQPRQAPGGQEQPRGGQQQGGSFLDALFAPFKAIGNFILGLFGLGGNAQQRGQPPPDGQRTDQQPPQ